MVRRNQAGDYRIEPLKSTHDRLAFSCGVHELDIWLERQAGQDQKRNLAAVFVLTPDGKTVAGFYSLSAHSIQAADLPPDMARKLPRFPLPVTLLGRMAVDRSLQGKGLGEFLLIHALERAWLGSREVASWAVVVNAKAGARDFYLKHDFIPFTLQPQRHFLPMQTIKILFE